MNRRQFMRLPMFVPAMTLLESTRRCHAAQSGASSKIYHGEKPETVINLTGKNRPVSAVEFSPDGSSLLVGHDDGCVRRFDASTGRETGNFEVRGVQDPIHAIAFAPDGRSFAIAAPVNPPVRADSFPKPQPSWHGAVSIFDDSGHEIRRLPRMSGKILALAFSKDGGQIAAIDQTYVLRGWRLNDGVEVFSSEAHKSNGQNGGYSAIRAGFASDLKRAVVLNDCPEGDYGGTPWNNVVRLVEQAGSPQRSIHYRGETLGSVAISADGSRIVTADATHRIVTWDFATGGLLSTNSPVFPPDIPAADLAPAFVAFSPDGRRIVVGSRRFAWVHEDDGKETGVALRTFEGPGGFIRAAAFLKDRIRFASGGCNIIEGEVVGGVRVTKFEPITIWDVKVPEKK